MSEVGEDVRRQEDHALITGEGRYTDDFNPPRCLHAAVLRSPFAHARVRAIDTSAAENQEGVRAVYTSEDVDRAGSYHVPIAAGPAGLNDPDRPLLARDLVRYAGEAVVVVLAEDRYAAQDALDRIQVDYQRLDPVADPLQALSEDAPRVHEQFGTNLAYEHRIGDREEVKAAFEQAEHAVELELENQRLLPNFMEPRAALAEFTASEQKLTLRMGTQNPHLHRVLLSKTLDHPDHKIRVIAPKVGGAFGGKFPTYPDEALTCWCAMQHARPVKWTSTRSEGYQSDAHARDHRTTGRLALDAEGRILALEADTVVNLGAYNSTYGTMVPVGSYGGMLSGPYRIPAIACTIRGVFTHTTPTDAYRGAGRPEATYLIERLVKTAAHELDVDPVEFRLRNFIPPDAFPYESPTGLVYDNGDYPKALEKALETLDYEQYRQRQADAREEEQRYLGIGFSSFVENTGTAPSSFTDPSATLPNMTESATVRVHPTGNVTVLCGIPTHGQGHKTTLAQVLADRLGIDYQNIEVIENDTEKLPQGTGTFGSRSAIFGGSLMVENASKLLEKGRSIAAHLLEAPEEDVTFDEGEFFIQGAPERAVSFEQVARRAHTGAVIEGLEGGWEATTVFDPQNMTFSFGTHVCVLEVEAVTGEIEILRYLAVDDVGNQINPMIVRGQIQGGLAQGIGQALYEGVVYDDQGNLTTGTLMDYAVPKAMHLPEFELEETVTPSEVNPLGVKGVGECGTIAAPPAVVNALVDALEPFGIRHLDMPLTPNKVWETLREARGG